MVADISREKLHKINQFLSEKTCQEHGFLTGRLGLAFYYHHAGRILGKESLVSQADALLTEVFDDVNAGGRGLRGTKLSSGATGLAYVVDYLQRHGFIDFEIGTELAEMDKFLFESALAELNLDNIDFLHGGMGLVHYFAGREQTPVINSYLNKLVRCALQKPVETGNGIWVRNHGLQPNRKDEINFGLSHGLCGYLLTLIEAFPHLIRKKRAAYIIRQGIQFIMKHQFPVDFAENEYSFFPFRFREADRELDRINRLAWCYGDLNHLLLLYRAGKLLDDSRYIQAADNMGAQVVTRRSYEATLSQNAHFCHGSSGLAQFYKCLFRETRNWMYNEAHQYWMAVTLSLIDGELENDPYSANDPGLLEGWTGIALVVADHLAGDGPNWSEALLL
jgi:lantibiotic modifying enzyme